jgi:hypothetical protein
MSGAFSRKPHVKRRPTLNPEAAENHRRGMQSILDRYQLERIVNMNQTSWKLFNTGFLNVADRGSEIGDFLFAGDPNMSLTSIQRYA